MTDNRNLLTLTPEEKQDLEHWAQSRTLPAGDVFRARLILALAEGQSYREIERSMHTSAATIARWRTRFEQDRLAGLEGRHKGSQPRIATATVQARVVRRVQQKPNDGSTHWSCRKLSRQLGVSKSTVQRILTQARLKPHRLERYLASDDPDFESKAADIIGLYLDPPQHAAVFCVDEKTAIQALDRLDPVLPLSPGRAERHGFEYYRHGTLSLYAALDVKTGRVEGKTAKGHTSAEFLLFLRGLLKKAGWAREIHIVLDNLSAHKTKAAQEFLEHNPKVRFHFTPTYSSWLNQVELWFAKIQRESSPVAFSPRLPISPASLGNIFELTPGPQNRFGGRTPIRCTASVLTKSPGQLTRSKDNEEHVARGGCFVAHPQYFCLRSKCISDFPRYFHGAAR